MVVIVKIKLITSVDTVFPQNNINTLPSIFIFFLQTYFVDATNDGVKDLIITSNNKIILKILKVVELYENSETNIFPNFNFIQKDFLQGSGLDFGENNHPTFYDHNGEWACRSFLFLLEITDIT